MKILLLHNTYRDAGGEDVAVERERTLLATHGHDVRLLTVSNRTVRTSGDRLRTALRVPYSLGARNRVAAEIASFRPDVVHVHNFFPLLTPSVYDACRAAGRPVVQTLHNYRLVCLGVVCFRDGRVGEDCFGTSVPWPGVLHRCCLGSGGASAAAATMIAAHRVLGTWRHKVDVYIAPTEFARRTHIRGGLPADRIVVKPHFVHPDPGWGHGAGGYALFAGRLSTGKGVDALLAAWDRLDPGRRPPLKIAGDGPLAAVVAEAARRNPAVEWLGAQTPSRVVALMQDAAALIFPSLFYETFGLVIAEAFAAGLPVIAASGGSGGSLVEHGRTGLLFRPGDDADLAAQVARLWSHPRERMAMRLAAREQFEHTYTAERKYQLLMDVYAGARTRASAMGGAA